MSTWISPRVFCSMALSTKILHNTTWSLPCAYWILSNWEVEKKKTTKKQFFWFYLYFETPVQHKTQVRGQHSLKFSFFLQLKKVQASFESLSVMSRYEFLRLWIKLASSKDTTWKAGSMRGVVDSLALETHTQIPLAGKKSRGVTQYVWTDSQLVVLTSAAISELQHLNLACQRRHYFTTLPQLQPIPIRIIILVCFTLKATESEGAWSRDWLSQRYDRFANNGGVLGSWVVEQRLILEKFPVQARSSWNAWLPNDITLNFSSLYASAVQLPVRCFKIEHPLNKFSYCSL